jgi:dCTP deaminase
MILSDSEIRSALKHGQIIIDPVPSHDKFSTSALDLTLGRADFKRWKVPGPGVQLIIDPSQKDFYREAAKQLKDVTPARDGSVTIEPDEFLLAMTEERVELPPHTRLAARVEGKSSLARIGLGIHITAPTIHCGFNGKIVLEIKNHGDLTIKLCPGMPVCQLIFEMVFGTPSTTIEGLFQNQDSVAGRSA